MNPYTSELEYLAQAILPPAAHTRLQALLAAPSLDYTALAAVDDSLGGPSQTRLTCNGASRCAIADRDVFHALLYCVRVFQRAEKSGDLASHTRHIVHFSSLHLEALIKRVGLFPRLPLGSALEKAIVRQRVDPLTWQQLKRFTAVYNAAKHDLSQPLDTHLFTEADAVRAYSISRVLGLRLYPLARLTTDLRVFATACA